jgi:DNA repair exonuclease SbcCD ATPase subunit
MVKEKAMESGNIANDAGSIEEFFSSLGNETQETKNDEHSEAKLPTVEELQKQMEQLKTDLKKAQDGYSGSSREAKRLQEELISVKQQIKSTENSKQPSDIFEALGIDKENFVFDQDEAIKNPNSDSGRVQRAYIAVEAARLFERQQKAKENEMYEKDIQKQFDSEKQALMKEYNLTEEQFNDWVEKQGKNLRLDLKTAWAITHQEELDKKRMENAIKEWRKKQMEQRSGLDNLPPTLIGIKGSEGRDPSGVFMDSIKTGGGFDITKLGNLSS